jgi:hypothetical protein
VTMDTKDYGVLQKSVKLDSDEDFRDSVELDFKRFLRELYEWAIEETCWIEE